uniref:Uncharacterized protein n=1 Tax=Panagrolaimus sp. PS1159 TaxID=55785 RepID=A0AC35G026_9BILA
MFHKQKPFKILGMKWLKLAADKGNANAIKELNIFQENFNNEMDFEDIIKEPESATRAHPLDFEQFGELVYVSSYFSFT